MTNEFKNCRRCKRVMQASDPKTKCPNCRVYMAELERDRRKRIKEGRHQVYRPNEGKT